MHTIKELSQAKNATIQAVQEETYAEKFSHIKNNEELLNGSSLKHSIGRFIDEHGLLQIGIHISAAEIGTDEKHPIINPGKHHIGLLLVRYYHTQTKHQGWLLNNPDNNVD